MLTQRQALRILDKYLLLFVNIKKCGRITAICHCQIIPHKCQSPEKNITEYFCYPWIHHYFSISFH